MKNSTTDFFFSSSIFSYPIIKNLPSFLYYAITKVLGQYLELTSLLNPFHSLGCPYLSGEKIRANHVDSNGLIREDLLADSSILCFLYSI